MASAKSLPSSGNATPGSQRRRGHAWRNELEQGVEHCCQSQPPYPSGTHAKAVLASAGVLGLSGHLCHCKLHRNQIGSRSHYCSRGNHFCPSQDEKRPALTTPTSQQSWPCSTPRPLLNRARSPTTPTDFIRSLTIRAGRPPGSGELK